MNPFYRVRNALGLTANSQGEHGYLYLMLTMMGDAFAANPTALVTDNPFKEVLRLVPGNSHAAQSFRQLLSYRAQTY